jgi:proline-specific peptidase
VSTNDIRIEEGYIPVGDYKVWYRSVGGGAEQEDIPILTLHGGPGIASYGIEDMQALASETRRVIFYDQLGCGRSDQPDNPSLWRIERFVEEVGIVRRALALDAVHLWGQSWDGMLAIEYVLTQPQGVVSLTLASATPSIPLWIAETNRLRGELPPEIQATLTRPEEVGTTGSEEYQAAVMEFYGRHLIRLSPVPEHVMKSLECIGQVYLTMNGPSEFNITSVIKEWDRIDRLHEIQVPTLLTSGRYDESTPLINETMHNAIAHSAWVLFEHSAHLSQAEEKERYMQTMSVFLKHVEAKR